MKQCLLTRIARILLMHLTRVMTRDRRRVPTEHRLGQWSSGAVAQFPVHRGPLQQMDEHLFFRQPRLQIPYSNGQTVKKNPI